MIFSVRRFYIINCFLLKKSCCSFSSAMCVLIYSGLVSQDGDCGQSQGEGKVDPAVASGHAVRVFSWDRRDLSSINISCYMYYHQVE